MSEQDFVFGATKNYFLDFRILKIVERASGNFSFDSKRSPLSLKKYVENYGFFRSVSE